MSKKVITVGSLFAGIGGIEKGLEDAENANYRFETRWQVEIDPYAQKVLAKHWPDCGRWDDVRTFPPAPAEDWRVDVICGGDPCQENSRARTGNHCLHTSLGDQFVRVVSEIRPKIVLRENPAGTRKDAPWPWWRMRSCLESLGYACVPFRLRACCFGADHQRERLFVFGAIPNTGCKHGLPRSIEKPIGQSTQWCETPNQYERSLRWPSEPSVDRMGNGIPCLMDRLRCLGNAVVPQIAQWIGERILESLP